MKRRITAHPSKARNPPPDADIFDVGRGTELQLGFYCYGVYTPFRGSAFWDKTDGVANPDTLQKLVIRCFTADEREYLERQPPYLKALRIMVSLDDVEQIASLGQRMLDERDALARSKEQRARAPRPPLVEFCLIQFNPHGGQGRHAEDSPPYLAVRELSFPEIRPSAFMKPLRTKAPVETTRARWRARPAAE